MNTVDVATPDAFVDAVAVALPPANVPLAPVEGAVKVTVAPDTPLPFVSFTVACSVAANAVLTVVVCGVPAVAVMLVGVPPAAVA